MTFIFKSYLAKRRELEHEKTNLGTCNQEFWGKNVTLMPL